MNVLSALLTFLTDMLIVRIYVTIVHSTTLLIQLTGTEPYLVKYKPLPRCTTADGATDPKLNAAIIEEKAGLHRVSIDHKLTNSY